MKDTNDKTRRKALFNGKDIDTNRLLRWLSDSHEFVVDDIGAAFFCEGSLWLARWTDNYLSLRRLEQAPGDVDISVRKLAYKLRYVVGGVTTDATTHGSDLITAFFYRQVEEPAKE